MEWSSFAGWPVLVLFKVVMLLSVACAISARDWFSPMGRQGMFWVGIHIEESTGRVHTHALTYSDDVDGACSPQRLELMELPGNNLLVERATGWCCRSRAKYTVVDLLEKEMSVRVALGGMYALPASVFREFSFLAIKNPRVHAETRYILAAYLPPTRTLP